MKWRVGTLYRAAGTARAGPGAGNDPLSPILASLRSLPSLLLTVLVVACGGDAPELPNLLLVTLDTTRADHLGCYGYFRETSPTLDELATEGLVFERCITPMATTLPTHTSLLTSSHPLEHGVLANVEHGGRRFVPAPGLGSVAEAARDAGYRTGAFISAVPLKRGSGVEVGFQTFDQPEENQRTSLETARAAADWVRAGERPFFLWVHFFDAHWPLDTPPEYQALFQTEPELERHLEERRFGGRDGRPPVNLMNAYDAELRFQDDSLRLLFERLRAEGHWDATVVAVVGDHGEGLFQHDERSHGGTWDEQLRVPFVLRAPGVPPGRVQETLSIMDVLPTVLGRVPALPATLEGFLERARGRDALAGGAGAAVLSRDTGREREVDYRRSALTGERWKYILFEYDDGTRDERLFDLRSDPHELTDRSAEEPALCAELRSELLARVRALEARGDELRGGQPHARSEEDPELVEALKDLGYTGY